MILSDSYLYIDCGVTNKKIEVLEIANIINEIEKLINAIEKLQVYFALQYLVSFQFLQV